MSTTITDAEAGTFRIIDSDSSSERRVAVPADLATCDDCLRELCDPADRRYRYPFINCASCGPRYSIRSDSPYDRARTSMASFTMCAACQREYESPMDRRFHAQLNACPECGPTLIAMSPQRRPIETLDPIRFAARSLRAGFIVAIKGLGGFHLACDASSPQAVQRLRDRKRRDSKPFAVMVRDLAEGEMLAELNEDKRKLLMSIERPIVLVKGRREPLLGLFLPYTPLHHLLLDDARRPLVMTPGNLSDESMVTTNAGAFERLHDIADVFLVHDREIAAIPSAVFMNRSVPPGDGGIALGQAFVADARLRAQVPAEESEEAATCV